MYRIFTQCGVRCFYLWLLHAEEKVKQFLTSHNIKSKKPKPKDCSHKWNMVCEKRQRTIFFSIDQVEKGIEPPSNLVSACNLLGEVKNFQDECVQVSYLHYILTSVVWAFFETGWSQLNEFVLNSKRKWDTSQTHISPPPTLTFSKSDKIRGTCCAMARSPRL